jgi:hypothetical protein
MGIVWVSAGAGSVLTALLTMALSGSAQAQAPDISGHQFEGRLPFAALTTEGQARYPI